jgi:hypothetical protein
MGLSIGQRDNFYYLFAGLLVLIVVGPVLTASLGDLGAFFAEVSISITLVVALWSLRSSPAVFFFAIALVLGNILSAGAGLLLGNRAADVLSQVIALTFFVLCSVMVAREIFHADRVDLNKIVGALCVYLLIGVIFAVGYQLLEGFFPGSFAGFEEHQGHALTWRHLYFSFVTLTTLGYGDILPLTDYAETLVVVEAVLGQFYLAVLVAGLVSSYLSDR